MRPRNLLALGAVLALVIGVAPARPWLEARPAQAAETWEVVAGGDVEASNITANAFFPQFLTVRAGDTVRWSFPSRLVPHSVAFLNGQAPLADVVPGPGAGELMLGPANFPAGSAGSNARFDGSELVNSGTPPPGEEAFTFELTFTQPGYFPYNCPIHTSGMHGAINVLPANAPPAESPAQATARGRAEFDQRLAQFEGQMLPQVQSTSTAGTAGANVRTVTAGFSHAAGMNALRFLPERLTVRRGDAVVWSLADPTEIHTITFTSGAPVPGFVDVRPQPEGPPQLVIPAEVAGPVGGGTYTGRGYLNSGIKLAGNSFALRVDAPAGTYQYVCVVHPNMKGTLVVEE
jgi:plastocyanin